jgi:hypothetical protein
MVVCEPPIMERPELIESLFKIDNKEGIVRPFKFNAVQRYFNLNKGKRNIVLKSRQMGISSSILADMAADCVINPNTYAAVISHETEAAKRLLDRVQFYYDTMTPPKPLMGADSRTEKTFPEMHSSIYIGTAGARAFGRGDTIRKALLSELAFYEDPEKILNGVEDAVPITGELTIECTPNGEDNLFHRKWVRAREGKSPYKPFFFPWWMDKGYTIPRGAEIALPDDRGELSFTQEEVDLISKNKLTEDQIRWRRWKIDEKEGLFWQEYPEDEISCFISIGDPVFDTTDIARMTQECYEVDKAIEGWRVWKVPEPKMMYTIGVDTSAGAPGGSYSGVAVLDSRWEVCATFQARIEPHLLAALLKKLGMWYNTAELAIERNFTGYAVLGHLLEYPNVYHQRDFTTGKITSNRGWWTNEQTKQFMITATKDHLAALHIHDMNLVRQLKGYRYIRYKPTAQTYDDLAMALMIAIAVRKVTGASRGYMGNTPGWGW